VPVPAFRSMDSGTPLDPCAAGGVHLLLELDLMVEHVH
jgi:hypothetical protein